MKTVKQTCFIAALALLCAINTKAQNIYTDSSYLNPFYVGLRGGYLLKNNSLNKNPLYRLNSGFFGEVNGGWRKNFFGWELSLGMLQVKRDNKMAAGVMVPVRDVLQSGKISPIVFKEAIASGEVKNADQFEFRPTDQSNSVVKNFSGIYALTGPRVWFGKNKIQGTLSVQGGVISRKFGYRYITGNSTSAQSFSYAYVYPGNEESVTKPAAAASTGTATVTASGNFSQYGMTEESYSTQTMRSKDAFLNTNEKSKIQFIARGNAGIEYYISPSFAISANADYFYMPSPKVVGAGAVSGTTSINFQPTRGTAFVENDVFNYNKNYSEKKNLGFLGFGLGLKFTFGNKKAPKEPEPPVLGDIKDYKSLLVKVIDKPTGRPLDGVTVKIVKQGGTEYTEALTEKDGNIPLQTEVEKGIYKITGEKNGIPTTEATISMDDFRLKDRLIIKELFHNDLRFSLAGETVNKQTKSPLAFIQTSLMDETSGAATQHQSDSVGHFNYQLEHNSDYVVFAQHKGFFSNKEKVTTKGLDRSKIIYVNLELEVIELKEGASIVLKDIYYDYNKHDIRPDAAKVLDNLVKTLNENPQINIELSSYTDSRGGDAFNLRLSQLRANAAVKYLIAKGIAADRLKATGYGETKLLNKCANEVDCSEEQHQINRRTEIKVIE